MLFLNKGFFLKTKHFFRRCSPLIVCMALIFFLVVAAEHLTRENFSFFTAGVEKKVEGQPAEDIIRFHIKANSNSPEDQQLKNYLAQKIMALYEPLWNRCANSGELRLLLMKSREALEIKASEIVQDRGFPYHVSVSLEKKFFPARLYAEKLYPPGEYEALYMVIGEGAGENWWCVIFPPLCFNLVPAPPAKTITEGKELAGPNRESGSVVKRDKRIPSVNRTAGSNIYPDNAGNKKPTCRFWLSDFFTRLFK